MQSPHNKRSEKSPKNRPEEALPEDQAAHEQKVNEQAADDKAHGESVISADAINRAIRKAAENKDDDTLQSDPAIEAADSKNDALAALKADYETRLGELKDQMLRAAAEAENVRRRAARDVEETAKYAVSGFARDMITVAENLYLALGSVPEEARNEEGLLKSLADGVDMTLRELLAAFEKHGIQRIDPLGEKFDHNRHQAVSQVEDPAKEPNTVLHVMQAGYVMHDRLLRPAMVVVSKKGAAEQKLDTKA